MPRLWRHLLQWLASSVMLHAYQALADTSLSGTIEVDLIFPKNGDIYEPTAIMPLVWAVQNANLAATLDAYIDMRVTASGGGRADWVQLHLAPANLTGKDVYYAYTYSDKFDVEAVFAIDWDLNINNRNCSGDIYYNDDNHAFGGSSGSFMTTKNGAQQADLVVAHSLNCSNTENVSFNITGTQPKYSGGGNSTQDQCAILSPTRPALDHGKPCNVKVDAAAASSITASLQAAFTQAQCAAWHPTTTGAALHPIVSCPTENAAEALHVQSRRRKNQALVFLTAAAVAVACM